MRKTMELAGVAGEFAEAAAECYGQWAPSPQLGQTSYWLLDVIHKFGSHDCLQKILDVMLLSAWENAAGRSFVVHREDGLLESALNALALKKSELEKELQDVSAKCAEYEGRASSSHQRGLEMEDLIQTSHSKAEGAEKKTVELELLLSSLCPSLKRPIAFPLVTVVIRQLLSSTASARSCLTLHRRHRYCFSVPMSHSQKMNVGVPLEQCAAICPTSLHARTLAAVSSGGCRWKELRRAWGRWVARIIMDGCRPCVDTRGRRVGGA